jgi:acetyl-CoA acyltransferase
MGEPEREAMCAHALREGPLRNVTYAGRLAVSALDLTGRQGVCSEEASLFCPRLKPVFALNGTVTAGNSSQTSDGAAAVLVIERERAQALGLKPLARFVGHAVGGVRPGVMGIGPVVAIPKALALTALSLDDVGLIELNEVFASQALAVIRQPELNEEITNVNGGAIALGHPLGCTGAKLTVQVLCEMKRPSVQFGLVAMCIGGGMGAARIIENLN